MTRDKDTHENSIAWYNQEFGFTANAATALHDEQMLRDASTLSELDDDAIANICKLISKESSQSVAKIEATKLKLACFWIRHQHWTSREIGGTQRPLVRVNYTGTIDLLQQQKKDEDNWTSTNKEPKYIPLTLDIATTMKVIDKVKSILARVRDVMGVPLYVIRAAPIPEDKKDDPPFGEEETKYTSVDMEMTAHATILSNKADFDKEFKSLKAYGPFVLTFLTNTKKVWSIFLACFGLSSMWQHVKNFVSQQNGRQAWCTLHDHFFGKDKVNNMVLEILLTLRSLHYSGDHKNFMFDKYCTAHVDQHNRHAALSKWNVKPLEETMKIHYFEGRITDPSFASVKSTIMIDRQKFQEFDAVMWLYVNYKCTQKAETPTHHLQCLYSPRLRRWQTRPWGTQERWIRWTQRPPEGRCTSGRR
jgi:hypothetical protein